MAVTQNSFTGNGSTTNFSFTFPYIKEADVKAKIDGVNTTAFTLANATTVSFTSAPASGAAIIIFRDTDNDEKTATFFAGSAVKAEDLNSNFDQVLFTAQEVDNNALQTPGGTMTGDLNFGQNANIVFEGATNNANETTLTVVDPTADRTITLPNVTGTVVTTGDTGTVATGMIADSAITSAKISDGTIATGDIADDAVTTAKIADANVTTALIADANVTTAKLASDAVTTAKITDANVTTAKIANDAITAAKIAADAVGSSEIAANAVTSNELADASVDTAAIVDANVTTAKVADSAITTAKINDSAITSAKIGANQVVEGKIADNAVTTSKIPDSGVTTPKIADNAVTNAKLADAELRELATMGSTTASALADLTQAEVQILDGATVSTNELNILDGVTANATEINQLDGNTLTNSFTASSTTQYPSSNAISGYVLGLMDNLGGFVAIANENSFPTTNPDPSDDAGTVVSISDAGGLVVSASGTASGQTTGGTAVTITGFPTALQSSTLPAGQGLQVVSTSTLNTYTYHKVLGTDADIAQLNDDVNDFFARYRIGSTNPTTDLDAGDLFFNTSTGKMLVYDATVSDWEEVQAVGNYFINTLSSSGGTGGGSATFNGSAYRFTLSNPGSVAQQHIVSINGVIQKPNSGTSQPSEGFAIDNADIILAAAPATGADFFIVTVGTSVNIGTPSNDTITNAMVKADAAIAGTKISPDFGSQNVLTTGNVLVGTTDSTIYNNGDSDSEGIVLRDGEVIDIARKGDLQLTLNRQTNDGHHIGFFRSGSPKSYIATRNDGFCIDVNSSERLRVNSAGRLLINTSSSVAAGSNAAAMLQVANGGGNLTGAFYCTANSTQGGTLVLGHGRGSATGVLQSGDTLGDIRFAGADGTDLVTQGAKIAAEADGTPGSNVMPGRITFSTNPGGSGNSPTERMVINSSGKVGIGETSVQATLHVAKNIADSDAISWSNSQLSVATPIAGNSTANRATIYFAPYGSDNNYAPSAISATAGTSGASTLKFFTNASGNLTGQVQSYERMRIGSDGKVYFGDFGSAASAGYIDKATSGSYELDIVASRSTSTNRDIRFFSRSNQESMRIDTSGRLLVGTTSDVSGGLSTTLIQGVAAGGGYVGLARNDTSVADGNGIGGLRFYANDPSGYNDVGIVQCVADGTHAANDYPTRLEFYTTADNASSPTERLRIDSSGNTTLGYAGASLHFNNGFNNSTSRIQNGGGSNSSNFKFLVKNSGSESEAMRINSSGRVGIGETSMDGLLVIKGDSNASSMPSIRLKDGTDTREAWISNTAGDLVLVNGGNDNVPHCKITLFDGNIMTFATANTERMRIDNSGRLLVGATSSIYGFTVAGSGYRGALIGSTNGATAGLLLDGASNGDGQGSDYGSISHLSTGELELSNRQTAAITFKNTSSNTERVRIDSSGNVGINNTSPSSYDSSARNLVVGSGSGNQGITIAAGASSSSAINFADGTSGSAAYAGRILYQHSANALTFHTNGGDEQIRINSAGSLLINNTSTAVPGYGNTTLGAAFESLGADGAALFVSRSGALAANFNRAQDGDIIQFASAGTIEGGISISGSTVSYNGAHLSRWSQLEGNAERTEILRGSVLSNIDEMCEWGEEDNEQLNRMKVSDVEGDVNVSGVFQAWDDDDKTYTNDFYCAMTGDFVIRIAQGTTVARGDLLMSAGDGTAKPQDDDIVRSKTIAKVTSTTVSTTYSDGSYCVPCVLMAC